MNIKQNNKGERNMSRLMKDVMLTSIPAMVIAVMFSLLFYGFLICVA